MARPAKPPTPLLLLHDLPHDCPYLPGRTAVNEFGAVVRIDPPHYQEIMDAGFRRSGDIVYRPVCPSCRECISIRVPVASFVPSRSQTRVLAKNRDVKMIIEEPAPTDAKWRLYAKYLRGQHGRNDPERRAHFESFLYRSPTETREMVYRLGRKIIAVGIVDFCPECISSVYFFFDPAHARRSLGTFGALMEIEECRRRGLAWWYIGYYIRDCRRMNYKANFRPYELLINGKWQSADG